MELLNDPKKRSFIFQLMALSVILGIIFIAYTNVQENLSRQNIASGFSFLEQEAGFEISETVLEYWSDDTYRKALFVGLLNTIKVAVIGNFLAILLGLSVALASLSKNWLLKQISQFYIETIRNIPLLLQLFFWYALFTELLPGIRDAINPISGVFISNRGLNFPILENVFAMKVIFATIGLSLFSLFSVNKISEKHRKKTGNYPSWKKVGTYLIYILPVIAWFILGAPRTLDYPEMQGFNFQGGYYLTPEFVALLLGLVLYTAAFNAEIIRGGILSVTKGQWEASEALGLNRKQTMKLVILPQALRVIIPPIISQLLNLTKNSSLAVAIAYPDFVAIANTTMNQTGQAIELVILIMLVYLILSLSTSFIMNIYNRKISLVER